MAQSTSNMIINALNSNPAFGIDEIDSLVINGTVTQGKIMFKRKRAPFPDRAWTVTHYMIDNVAEQVAFYWSSYDLESECSARNILAS